MTLYGGLSTNAPINASTLTTTGNITCPGVIASEAQINTFLRFNQNSTTPTFASGYIGGTTTFIGTNKVLGFGTDSSTPAYASGCLQLTDAAGGIKFGDGPKTTGSAIRFGENSAISTAISGHLVGSFNYNSGTMTFGTNSTTLSGRAQFANQQSGAFTFATNSNTGFTTITGLTSSSVVIATPKSEGAIYTGGAYSVDTSVNDILRVWATNSGLHSFNYFVPRF
jgi:hypothetical protein